MPSAKPHKSKPTGLKIDSGVDSRGDPESQSSPMNLQGIDLSSLNGAIGMDGNALPPLPKSPPIPQGEEGGFNKENAKGVGSAVKSRTTSDAASKVQRVPVRQAKDDEDVRPSSSSMSKIYHLRKNPGSTPELSLVGSKENVRSQSSEGNTTTSDLRPQPSPHHSEDSVSVRRKDKGFRNPLARSKSIRRDSQSKSKPNGKPVIEQPPRTAPISADWQEMLMKSREGGNKRGKSAERAIASESDENQPTERMRQHSTKDKNGGGGSSFVSGSKNVMTKAVTGGGNFISRLGKMGRSSSSTEKEIPDSEYRLKVINLPLVEQTRITRISKDLSVCRDKTEFWMPSLPWRCIDYLNQNCESEGLYRVPGSGPQVKHWQRRFDTELDVDLLGERELYDPNTIGSMLKSWLRDLPTEIMPKELQSELAAEIAQENPDYQKAGQPVSQILRDALSNLPPFNYYLLFAITCHLSLLLAHQETNKMDLNNLSICIGPCLDLERWLFNYLVGDWRHCWQGCDTEKEFMAYELAHEQGNRQPPSYTSHEDHDDDRAIYSSGRASSRSRATSTHDTRSAQHSPTRIYEHHPDLPQSALVSKFARRDEQEPRRPATAGKGSEASSPGDSTTPKGQASHARSKSDFQISPVKPGSPVEFPFAFREH